jgi:hypothetical protein
MLQKEGGLFLIAKDQSQMLYGVQRFGAINRQTVLLRGKASAVADTFWR